tara:strand:+ start:796 stop:1050 length:255 start_codon:yes stop_codon:yes gene_type:complete
MSTTTEIEKPINYGYYSEKQKNLRCNAMRSQRGRYPKSSIYLNTNGETVEVTEVSKKSPEEFDKRFDDVIYVGIVTKWVRSIFP